MDICFFLTCLVYFPLISGRLDFPLRNPSMDLTLVGLYFWGAMPCCMQDLSSLTRDRTCAPAVEVRSLNHWTPEKSWAVFDANFLVLGFCVPWTQVYYGPSLVFQFLSLHFPSRTSASSLLTQDGECIFSSLFQAQSSLHLLYPQFTYR